MEDTMSDFELSILVVSVFLSLIVVGLAFFAIVKLIQRLWRGVVWCVRAYQFKQLTGASVWLITEKERNYLNTVTVPTVMRRLASNFRDADNAERDLQQRLPKTVKGDGPEVPSFEAAQRIYTNVELAKSAFYHAYSVFDTLGFKVGHTYKAYTDINSEIW